jgi:hypothetical protein
VGTKGQPEGSAVKGKTSENRWRKAMGLHSAVIISLNRIARLPKSAFKALFDKGKTSESWRRKAFGPTVNPESGVLVRLNLVKFRIPGQISKGSYGSQAYR